MSFNQINPFKFILILPILALTACGGDSGSKLTEQDIQLLNEKASAFSGMDTTALQSSTAAMSLASSLYQAECASCHGADATGQRRIPNLVSAVFDYGDSIEAIHQTIAEGRHSIMPKMGQKLGEVDLGVLALYVKSFSTGMSEDSSSDRALELYAENCQECHGEYGAPTTELGIPDLRDESWQHGDSTMNIRLTMTNGVDSECPAQSDTLNDAAINLLTAYVVNLRNQ